MSWIARHQDTIMGPRAQNQRDDGFDTSKVFIRVTKERANGFVEFDFAIGEAELFAEMLLTSEGFAEFCGRYGIDSVEALELHRSGRAPLFTEKLQAGEQGFVHRLSDVR